MSSFINTKSAHEENKILVDGLTKAIVNDVKRWGVTKQGVLHISFNPTLPLDAEIRSIVSKEVSKQIDFKVLWEATKNGDVCATLCSTKC